jgi:hypothetical protein
VTSRRLDQLHGIAAEVISNLDKEPWPPSVLEAHLHKAEAVVTFIPYRTSEDTLGMGTPRRTSSQSDFLVLTLPLTSDSKHLFHDDRLKLIKPGR